MPTYAIGDIQGCYTALQRLLENIHFDPSEDRLWFTGDLVNRGRYSLEVLRFIKQLGDNQRTVLGNHDLHLLACAYQQNHPSKQDTFADILTAPDREELIDWLRRQRLVYHDEQLGFTLVHAGLAPSWDLAKSLALSHEVETILQSTQVDEFLGQLYGDMPNYWDEALQHWPRLRAIVNYCTRMRFCYPDGRLELSDKIPAHAPQEGLIPWFRSPQRKTKNLNIIFGHWAALGGVTHTPNVYALDTGCVWGFKLTAMRLEDGKRFTAACESEDRE